MSPFQTQRLIQELWLKASALKHDSELLLKKDYSVLSSPSSTERYLNLVSRFSFDHRSTVSSKEKVKKLIKQFKNRHANFTWHLWEDNNHQNISEILTAENLLRLGNGIGFALEIPQDKIKNNSSMTLKRLETTNFGKYVDVKMDGWNILPSFREKIEHLVNAMLNDPNHLSFLAYKGKQLLGACNAYTYGSTAYLRGSCIKKSKQGNGHYQEMCRLRIDALKEYGIKTAITIADAQTSAKSLSSLGYSKFGKLSVWASKEESWISP